jgi:hypothetical protein
MGMTRTTAAALAAAATTVAFAAQARAVSSIDPYYSQSATGCTGSARPGATALHTWVKNHEAQGAYGGIYSCRTTSSGGYSLHAEGRALDWFLDNRVARQRKAADAIVKALLRRRHGHNHALARRMGVQEIIWNCRIWTSSQPSEGLRHYSRCTSSNTNRTDRHEDHIHIGLSREGADRLTGFWRNGAWPEDLAALKYAGSSSTEWHALDGGTGYRSFLFNRATGLHKTSSSTFQFLVGDYDGDWVDDLWAIKYAGGSGRTEVHVFSGANPGTQLLAKATGLHQTSASTFAFGLGDHDHDGRLDLYAIKYAGASSTEVHVLSGASGFTSFIRSTATALHKTSSTTFQFAIGDDDNDGIDDVYAIKHQGASSTEVFVLDGSSTFQRFDVATGTALHKTTASTFRFLVGDKDDDGREDVFAVKYAGGSGTTEVFALSGAAGFGAFNLQTSTGLHQTSPSTFGFALPAQPGL